jgi:hypothetical protein
MASGSIKLMMIVILKQDGLWCGGGKEGECRLTRDHYQTFLRYRESGGIDVYIEKSSRMLFKERLNDCSDGMLSLKS